MKMMMMMMMILYCGDNKGFEEGDERMSEKNKVSEKCVWKHFMGYEEE